MSMSAGEARQVSEWSERTRTDVEIRFRRTSDARSLRLESFLDQFWKLAPQVRIVVDDEGESGPPAISVRENLKFHAVPEGLELEPFLDLLQASTESGSENASDAAQSALDEAWPATIKVYISPRCPHCPQAVRQVGPLALKHPQVTVTVIDGALFPELAERDGIRSAPTVLLDDAFRWTGAPPRDEFFRAIRDRDPTQLSAESLERMLKEGEAERLAEMILGQGRVFPAFQRLIDHPEWSVRLGAVVVMEELAEKNRDLARLSLEPVWDRVAELDHPVKGDVIYLSGLVGSTEWVPDLTALRTQETSEELQEVVDEALGMIASRAASP
jgi:hypothetical protein